MIYLVSEPVLWAIGLGALAFIAAIVFMVAPAIWEGITDRERRDFRQFLCGVAKTLITLGVNRLVARHKAKKGEMKW